VTVTETVFTKPKLGGGIFKNNCHGKVCENLSVDIIIEVI